MLVLNSYRLHQMLQLVRDVKKSVNSDLSMEWLKPFMTERQCAAGEVLFYKDEKAEDMLYIVSGRFKLVESGIELPVGAIVGELGMLSPSNMRTQTLECVEAGLDPERQLHARSRSSTCRIRLSASTSFASPAPGCSRTSRRWSSGWRSKRRPPLRRSPHRGLEPREWQTRYPVLAALSVRRFHRRGRRHAAVPARRAAGAGDGGGVSDAIHLLIDYQGAGYAAALCRPVAALHRQAGRRRRDARLKSRG